MSLKILTQNVWFSSKLSQARTQGLCRLIDDTRPDVILLQEVTPAVLKLLRSHEFVDRYDFSKPPATSYFTTTMCRSALNPSFTEFPIPSEMGRTLLLTEFDLTCGRGDAAVKISTTVGNVHLESLDNAVLRKRQLDAVHSRLSPRTAHSHVFLCGDFNIDADRTFDEMRRGEVGSRGASPENLVLLDSLRGFRDAWPSDDAADRGYTFDVRVNEMIFNRDTPYEERMRYDRIFHSLGPGGLKLSKCEVVGNAPLLRDDGVTPAPAQDSFGTPVKPPLPVFISDHFGILATLES